MTEIEEEEGKETNVNLLINKTSVKLTKHVCELIYLIWTALMEINKKKLKKLLLNKYIVNSEYWQTLAREWWKFVYLISTQIIIYYYLNKIKQIFTIDINQVTIKIAEVKMSQ